MILVLSSLTALTACGTRPAPADARAAAYEADSKTCNGSVPDAVDTRNAKTGLSWFASPIRRWGQIDDGVSACMAEKGWGRTRECTAEERRTGARTVTVTAAGIRCTDPATRS